MVKNINLLCNFACHFPTSGCRKSKQTAAPSGKKMTGGSSNWNQETKARLSDKVAQNMNDVAPLTRQILRGSKSSEVLMGMLLL